MDSRENGKFKVSGISKLFGKKSIGSITVVLLVLLYGFLQPRLNERFSLNLPGLPVSDHAESGATRRPDSQREIDADATLGPELHTASPRSLQKNGSADYRSQGSKHLASDKDNSDLDTIVGPQNQSRSASKTTTDPQFQPTVSAPKSDTDRIRGPPKTSSQQLLFGILREVSHDRFLSPQGLQYLPGSAEGHRLEHLRRHTKDQPTRPGKHGVFDGGMEGTLITVDSAYLRAKKNERTTKETDRKRTIYTVDMGKRVGFVGGREGKRIGNPMARRVKLVLEGTSVITAYPL